jgi:hypothetical protein
MPKPLSKAVLKDRAIWRLIDGIVSVVISKARNAIAHVAGYDAVLHDDDALRTVMETVTGRNYSGYRGETLRSAFIEAQGGNRIQIIDTRFCTGEDMTDAVFCSWVTAHERYERKTATQKDAPIPAVVPDAFSLPSRKRRKGSKGKSKEASQQ